MKNGRRVRRGFFFLFYQHWPKEDVRLLNCFPYSHLKGGSVHLVFGSLRGGVDKSFVGLNVEGSGNIDLTGKLTSALEIMWGAPLVSTGLVRAFIPFGQVSVIEVEDVRGVGEKECTQVDKVAPW